MRTKHHLHCVKGSVKDEKEWTSCDIYILIFPLPAVSPALLPSVCLPVTLLHTLVNEAMTHTLKHTQIWTHTHSSRTACGMVWAADISLQAICQSELDALTRTHTITHSYMQILSVNEGFFFSPVYLIKHTCALDSHYITLHSRLWLSAI